MHKTHTHYKTSSNAKMHLAKIYMNFCTLLKVFSISYQVLLRVFYIFDVFIMLIMKCVFHSY